MDSIQFFLLFFLKSFRISVMGSVDSEITGWVNVTDHESTFFSTSVTLSFLVPSIMIMTDESKTVNWYFFLSSNLAKMET